MPSPLSTLRKALWHFRHGGVEQVRLWWSRTETRRSRPSSATTSSSAAGAAPAPTVRNSDLARDGFPFPEVRESPEYEPVPRHVLYFLHNALPYHSGGYATRTHGLLTELNRMGWDVDGVTRLGYPYDMPKMADVPDLPARETVGDVDYHHLLTGRQIEKKNPMFGYTDRYVDALLPLARAEQPAILHGASNHWNGLAAVKAGNILGIPSVYEVRGLWEVTRASRDPEWGRSDQYRYLARMEADTARAATRVIAITEALKAELVERGVAAEKITVVPNGVDTARFTPLPRDEELAARLGVIGRTVIGYVGTVVDYEGLDLLLETAASLRARRDDFHVLIIGDGAKLEELQASAAAQGLDDVVTFTGRVPHEEVERYYSIIDITPFPRLPLPVTEMVSPLKPFEAMAMGKAVVAADVAALAEIVTPGMNGLLHEKGSAASLTAQIERLLDEPELRAALGARSRDWVVAERDWRLLAERVATVYEEALV
ncbi:glycosyltransferase family 4 protein [Brachybacterium muris]|uniref:glycosyltransferase family 4 protein n=1 Tax=Brachybacterium muris TaxID=219301 RepID=UPI00223B6E80|nr:glycosyltransferase family 4 protein [Brachybacterium muris]MCT2260343.1 glycosyltransferase family 4 protein [Brachybacterium muris]